MKIKSLILSLLLLAAYGVVAQDAGGIKGRVVERNARVRILIDEARVVLNTPIPRTVFARNGEFEFTGVPAGTWELVVEAHDYVSVRLNVRVENEMNDINFVSLSPEFNAGYLDDMFTPEFDSETGGGSQDMPVSLSASRDIFNRVVAYTFSQMRFRSRGYETSSEKVYLNGIYFNDAQSGYTPWSLWGGLNEATRNQEVTSAMDISDYGIGSINGTANINAIASQLRKGWTGSLVNASGQYLFRGMLTYASDESKNGWTYAFSASTRQGGNFWINGVYYNAFAYYASVEKRFGEKQRLALTAFGAPTIRGVQGASTQEAYDLVSSNYYNPNWGYQGGTYSEDGRKIAGEYNQMRNARERHNHEPVVMLNYSIDINPNNKMLAALSYRFGRNGYSTLDWYDAPDPRPDYYRYLPSYFSQNATPANNDQTKANLFAEAWLTDWNVRQINWDGLYNVNYNSYFDPNDNISGTNPQMRRSKYIIGEYRTDQQDVNGKLQLVSLLSNDFKFSAGYDFRWNRTEYFKSVKDLLGGDVWLDIDQFAERDFGSGSAVQNNLNNPNRLVKEGDKYAYNYYSHLRNDRMWTILRYQKGQWESYLALENGHTAFSREGLYRKGLFPDNSYGKSEKQNFWTYSAKANLTYKITGQHWIWTNIGYFEEAPYFQNAMVSPRTRNDFLSGLTTEKTFSVDLNYSLRFPWLRARMSGYYTTIKDQASVISFYDDLQRTFCNFAMRGIDQMHTGFELGLEAPLVYDITLRGALSYGYYIYTSNPTVVETADNSNKVLIDNETVYWKNYKISGTPQTAMNIALDYRSRRNIFAGIDLAYYNANYISMNPLRRTDYALQNLSDEQAIRQMTKQEMFPSAFVLNANIGKTWYLGKYRLGVNLNAQNLLNDTNIKSGGYEQMRLARNRDANYFVPFDSKYYYLMGVTYYLNVHFRF